MQLPFAAQNQGSSNTISLTMSLKLNLNKIKVTNPKCIRSEVTTTPTLASKMSPLDLSSKKVGDDTTQCSQCLERSENDSETGHSEQKGLDAALLSHSALNIKCSWNHQDIERSIKIKYSGNITSNETVNIAQQMWH